MAGGSSLKNMVVAFLVPLPSILFYLSFVRAGGDTGASPLASWCAAHPLVLANVLFFLNVDVLFWLVGLLLSNHWLIDLYWTVIPVMLLHYYRGHPASVADAARSAVAVALTWAWSARLTHNYLRREGWELGKREDWRFNEMRAQYGNTWWWMSFFAVYLSQQVRDQEREAQAAGRANRPDPRGRAVAVLAPPQLLRRAALVVGLVPLRVEPGPAVDVLGASRQQPLPRLRHGAGRAPHAEAGAPC
uniref:Uncharacterized protein n=1 Tax=Zea mays TaxID=4577 RepID=A0A804RHE2_MAIZE